MLYPFELRARGTELHSYPILAHVKAGESITAGVSCEEETYLKGEARFSGRFSPTLRISWRHDRKRFAEFLAELLKTTH
jgi:hypothetical protein